MSIWPTFQEWLGYKPFKYDAISDKMVEILLEDEEFVKYAKKRMEELENDEVSKRVLFVIYAGEACEVINEYLEENWLGSIKMGFIPRTQREGGNIFWFGDDEVTDLLWHSRENWYQGAEVKYPPFQSFKEKIDAAHELLDLVKVDRIDLHTIEYFC